MLLYRGSSPPFYNGFFVGLSYPDGQAKCFFESELQHSHTVEFFKFFGWKLGRIQICDDSFIDTIANYETDNPERHIVILNTI